MHDPIEAATRRGFLAAGAAAAVASQATAPKIDEPPKAVEVPGMKAKTEAQAGPPPAPAPPAKRLGFAVVGLGELALGEVLPAFGRCKYARPTALVSGDRAKAEKVADQYGIGPEHIYDYQNFDRIADDPTVDVVYIILPNSMHREFTVRAAKAGKHVLCEKPMANTSAECEAMIAACESARRLLMIAYRCQYEPHHREMIRLARSGELGPIRMIEASNGQNQGPADQWRHKKALAGGGSLPDVGIYCLNAARYITGEEPVQVTAQIAVDPSDPRFREVEDRISFQLRFPSGVLAVCQSFYSAHESRRCRVLAEKGWIDMDPAFAYHGLRMKTSRARDEAELTTAIALPEHDQFALEMDHMARRVAAGERPHTPGEEGLQDIRIIEAIYRAAREGKPVDLAAVEARDATRGPAPG
ncbi:Gfo/Idh/MocA family protein [Paludisphaera mucosa]|uniref:Gfo/Idh/MocA family oxidoreductase n=1 Tax=Paludisphaera mucosa TaxID=3030827 RepID=A0ABT6FBX9_9BACT|nr:Gfo/Idh/MocA family oxidoreductase [Paludisphaera mucosa]MDG3005061.1 Gfo/Idh/MocA family oxidoreductase [Paludisphaera mucosa]